MLYTCNMIEEISYQGRKASQKDIRDINTLIESYPDFSRTKLSRELCKKWNWVQHNGMYKDQICRGYLLALERAGYITLPARRFSPNNPLANRKKPPIISLDQSILSESISSISPICIRQVRFTNEEPLYNSVTAHHHYLGYTHPVGESLKYLVYGRERLIGSIGFSSAPRHISARDKYIGWDQHLRKKNIHLIAYNTRFLILPWIRVKHLASHVLSLAGNRVSDDWMKLYHHPIYLLETFVDTDIFKGTCYKAANWVYVGKTTGRGKNDKTHKPNRSIKSVWCYPLHKKFREQLTSTFY